MCVIGGAAKGRRLATLRTVALRPTPDRVREALFDILGDWIIGARVPDLFAGSGAVGIEALSREAQTLVFVETFAPACRVIATNLQRCGLHTRAMVWQADVRNALPIDARSACKTACVQWPQRLRVSGTTSAQTTRQRSPERA